MNFRSVVLLLVASVGFSVSLFGQTFSDFNPKYGSPGDSVQITGSGFFGNHPTVRFSSTNGTGVAANYFLNSDGLLTVTNVPNGIATGPISLDFGFGPINSSIPFTSVGPGPFISDFSPTVGATNDPVTINGVHFFNVTSVKFNGTTAAGTTATSDGTQINNVFVPFGATTGPIVVTTTTGSYTSSTPFTVIGPGPYISGFNPGVGSPGGSFSIQGRHLNTVTNVSVGNVSAVGVFLQGETQIFATNSGAVQTGLVSVKSPQGGHTNDTLFYVVPVVVSSFLPTNGPAGTSVTIKGQNFLGATNVQFSGVNASFIAPTNNTNLIAIVPLGAASGIIHVFTPGGQGFLSATNFRISPLITGFSPAGGGPGASVVISGANLNEGLSSVKFNGTNASFSAPAFGSVTVTVPTNVVTGPISLTTSNGTVTTISNFFGSAAISAFTPTNSAPDSMVKITGINFTGAFPVAFNGTPTTFYVTNNTTIGAVVPAGVSTGPITVTTPAGTVSSGSQLFYGAPVISSFLPTHGLPGTNVTILGTNFLGATAVRFNNLDAATFNVVNNGTIQATVPNGASTGPISITAPAGIANSANNFVLDFASDVAVLLTGSPDPVFVGSNLVYTIVLTNIGPFAAPNVFLTNTLPDSVQISAASTTAGSINTNANPVIGTFGSLGIGAGAVVTLKVVPQSVGTLTNRVFIVSDYPDPVPGNNSATLTTTAAAVAVLSIQYYPQNQTLQIAWPLSLTNYVLQFNTVLSTNLAWSNSTAPIFTSGDQKFVIEPLSSGEKFYRLKQ